MAAAAVLHQPGLFASWSGGEPGTLGVLDGPAVGWVERSRPWLEKVAGAAAERQSVHLSQLGESLDSKAPEKSTRAAILIGALLADERIDPPVRIRARDELMGQLERRIDTGARWSVGADIVSARSLDSLTPPGEPSRGTPSIRQRLAALASGQTPHPDLAVRVECAATALALTARADRGDEVSTTLTEFLLAVLRAETPDQIKSPRTWPRITTLAWVKTRSAETLARWTDTKNFFRPDGPWAHQMEEADRFESLVR